MKSAVRRAAIPGSGGTGPLEEEEPMRTTSGKARRAMAVAALVAVMCIAVAQLAST